MDLTPREQNWIHLRQLWSKRFVYWGGVEGGKGCGGKGQEPWGLVGGRQLQFAEREASLVGLKGGVWKDWASACPSYSGAAVA